MKLLLSVITTLLRINGVIGVLLVLFLLSMGQPKSEIAIDKYQQDHDSENFRRHLRDADADYQRQIQEKDQKLQSKENELQMVKAELENIKYAAAMNKSTDDLAPSKSTNPDKKVSSSNSLTATKLKSKPSSVSTKVGTQTTSQSNMVRKERRESSKGVVRGSQNFQKSSDKPILEKPMVVSSVFSSNQQVVDHKVQINSSISNVTIEKTSVTKSSQTNVSNRSQAKTANKEDNHQDVALYPQKYPANPQNAQKSYLNAETIGGKTQSSITQNPRNKAIHLANDLSIGLLIAGQKHQINYGTRTYRKVQTAIRSLRKGTSLSLEQASKRSSLDPSVLKQVAKWGEERPGSLQGNHQISLVETNKTED
ncbi:MAG TPA: hypothetical protein DCF68_05160 [Cyanothece sp. UBA12306]|nr:hypothetical protein [Cyanothece sp. UBA12306]